MAWMFSKAENLLNSLDQSASQVLTSSPASDTKSYANGGTALHQTEFAVGNGRQNSHTPVSSSQMTTSASAHNLTPTELANTANIRRTPSDSTLASPSAQPKSRSSKLRADQDDEKLFEFLNKPSTGTTGRSSPLAGERRRDKKNAVVNSGGGNAVNGRHSRQSSTSSTVSSKSARVDGVAVDCAPISTTDNPVLLPAGDDQPDSRDSAVPPLVNNISDSDRSDGPEEMLYPSAPHQEDQGMGDERSHQLSSLELENKLLRNEVASLNQEMASALSRARKAQEELQRVKSEMQRHQNQISSTDGIICQLQAREEDLVEELGAKNSQLAVLRVRLQEADGELKAKAQRLEELTSERDRILRDHSDASGVHSNALDSVKDRLTETESLLKREQDAYKTAQVEFMERQGKLETEQQNLAEALTSSQKKYHEEKSNSHQLVQQLKIAKTQLESAKEELGDYKQKATRILQSKDKLIASLKDGAGPSDGSATSGLELEEIRNERDSLREELQMANGRLQQLRSELQELEALQQSESDTAQDQIRDLEDQLTTGQQQLREAETDLRQKGEELRYMEGESYKTKMSLQARLQDREDEIQKLRNQLMTRSVSSTSQSELESRLHALTESLIQKQTMLEALSTEKNSLVMQLERAERQWKEAQVSATRSESHTVTLRSTDDEEGTRQRGLPSFLRETPLDAVVTKNVKRAANTIDKFSIRLGVFLRRYPIARLFVIAYMILLHIWVMIVLLTYTPEIHGSDFHPQGPK
ncbi:golgin subfamily A member 5-like [Acanthaster planci]|uniref:Golgin subfamily A member 5-like n=1 Tax=Acanthaster planci TaxID=133434 RepID=A0A8B7ZFZ1_ACAPL|nr:golgin subfamily A member 5-like [Acanthaster planci]XP_022103781.1 golgin subfamily A member 5-like [Acanthaster planci]